MTDHLKKKVQINLYSPLTFIRNFQSFETNQSVDPNAGSFANAPYNGSYYDPTAYAAPDPVYDGTTSDFDNEPPLLEGEFLQDFFFVGSVIY